MKSRETQYGYYAKIYREDICLQTLLLLFKYANHKNKRSFVSTANEALVGTLMTIGDINNIFPIKWKHRYKNFEQGHMAQRITIRLKSGDGGGWGGGQGGVWRFWALGRGMPLKNDIVLVNFSSTQRWGSCKFLPTTLALRLKVGLAWGNENSVLNK